MFQSSTARRSEPCIMMPPLVYRLPTKLPTTTRGPSLTHRPISPWLDQVSTGSELTSTWPDSYRVHSAASSRSPDSTFAIDPPTTTTTTGGGNKKTQYHKTKMCPWHRDGKCFMGSACNYAHSREELRPKPDLSKTKLCPELVRGRRCSRAGCRFAHEFTELRATSAFFKTRLCKFYQRGCCPAGSECRHAHGRDDLRASAIPASNSNPPSGWGDDNTEVVPPLPSTVPSPSFQSTSSGSGSSAWRPPREEQLLTSTPIADAATSLLRDLISKDEFSAAPDQEAACLPIEVINGLSAATPAAHANTWMASPNGGTGAAASPSSFAAAVCNLFAAAHGSADPATPNRLLFNSIMSGGIQAHSQ